KQLLHNEQIAEAVTVSYLGIQYYPNFYPLHYTLGEALMADSKWDQAIAAYRQVQELNPNWLEIEEKLNLAVYKKNQSERYLVNHYESKEYSESTVSIEIVNEEIAALVNEEDEISDFSSFDSIEINSLFIKLKQKELQLSICQGLWQNFQGHQLNLNYGCWLSPSILYLEATVDKCWVLNEAEILVCSEHKYAVAPANFFQISHQQVVGVACFENDLYLEEYDEYCICIKYNYSPVLVEGKISSKAYGLEFIEHLKTKPNHQKHLIRETLSSSIIKLIPESLKPEAENLFKKLQYFLDIPPVNYVDPNLPFKIFIDYIIPLKYDGVFISGWLQDPYQMLEKITAISALGFSLNLSS
ncbi:MAG: tetratricopeptide repeat protein, partial [Waterburya sp.]